MKLEDGNYLITLTEQEAKVSFNICAFGCGGTGKPEQKAVAEAVTKEADKIDIVLNLGDIFYGGTPSSGTSQRFQDQFYIPYQEIKVPFFITLGNHEYLFQKDKVVHTSKRNVNNIFKRASSFFTLRSTPSPKQNRLTTSVDITAMHPTFEMHDFQPTKQTAAQKNPHIRYLLDHESEPLLPPPNITLENITKLNISSNGYYTITVQVENSNIPLASIIVLDSNTFIKNTEQQDWLQTTLTKINSNWVMLACHHPLHTYGKRHNAKDAPLYEIDDDTESNYNKLFKDKLIEVLGTGLYKIQLVLCAHDHSQCISELVIKDHKLLQIISGGGGGKLQDIMMPSPEIRYFAKDYGFLKLAINKAALNLSFIDIENSKLCEFIYTNEAEIRQLIPCVPKLDFFLQIEQVIHSYFNHIVRNGGPSKLPGQSGLDGINRAIEIWKIARNATDVAITLDKIINLLETSSSIKFKQLFNQILPKHVIAQIKQGISIHNTNGINIITYGVEKYELPPVTEKEPIESLSNETHDNSIVHIYPAQNNF